jgi:hypothetical protein
VRKWTLSERQRRVGRDIGKVLPTGGPGITKQQAILEKTSQCSRDLLDGGIADPDGKPGANAWLVRFVRNHHAYILSRAGQRGRFDYDLYPHHIWSNPFAFDCFKKLDKCRIITYRWIVDCVCFHVSDNVVNRRLLGRYEDAISVDSAKH